MYIYMYIDIYICICTYVYMDIYIVSFLSHSVEAIPISSVPSLMPATAWWLCFTT